MKLLGAFFIIFGIVYGLYSFEQILIEAKPLEEIKITVQHRITPPIVTFRLRQCHRKHPHNNWTRGKCVNEAFDI